jgi:hypothetical protein
MTAHPPDQEPEDPGADTARFRAFVEGDDEAATRSRTFPTGLVVLAVVAAVLLALAFLLLRG